MIHTIHRNYPVKPMHIGDSVFMLHTFDHIGDNACKSAQILMAFFQWRDRVKRHQEEEESHWSHFTCEEVTNFIQERSPYEAEWIRNFSFNGLEEYIHGYISELHHEEDNTEKRFQVTDKFILKCFQDAPSEGITSGSRMG